MTRWMKELERLPKRFMAPICIVLMTVVALVDFATGYEMVFFLFYLPAILMGAWFVNFSFGILIAALSVTAWISSNIAAGLHYSNDFVPIWNALIMFAVYLLVLLLLSWVRRFQNELEERVRLRTESLAKEVRERVRLQRELLETSEREQRRIGRDLHDGLCQHLTGMTLAGHALGRKLTEKSPTDAMAANRMVELLEEAIEMTRALSRGLNPVEMEVGRLADNFRELAEITSSRFKVECRFECPHPLPTLDVMTATHLYRIAQEAATNAAQHSKAKRIIIGLDGSGEGVILTVTDNGSGLPEEVRKRGGLGLRLMAYRADLLGAACNIDQLAEGGTRVTCDLPFIAARTQNP